MPWLWILLGLWVVSIATLFTNIGIASKMVGSEDNWIQVQAILPGFVKWGLSITGFIFLPTAGLLAYGMGPDMAWSLSLILSIIAFGIAFGAVAMASIGHN